MAWFGLGSWMGGLGFVIGYTMMIKWGSLRGAVLEMGSQERHGGEGRITVGQCKRNEDASAKNKKKKTGHGSKHERGCLLVFFLFSLFWQRRARRRAKEPDFYFFLFSRLLLLAAAVSSPTVRFCDVVLRPSSSSLSHFYIYIVQSLCSSSYPTTTLKKEMACLPSQQHNHASFLMARADW